MQTLGNFTSTHKAIVAALTTLIVVVACAGAYWALFGNGAGSTPPTSISKGEVPANYILEPSFAANALHPSMTGVPLVIKVTNSGTASQVKNIKATTTVDSAHSTAGCLAVWFVVKSTTGVNWTDPAGKTFTTPVAIPVKVSTDYSTALDKPEVVMLPEGSVDQKACLSEAEGGVGATSATVVVALTATP